MRHLECRSCLSYRTSNLIRMLQRRHRSAGVRSEQIIVRPSPDPVRLGLHYVRHEQAVRHALLKVPVTAASDLGIEIASASPSAVLNSTASHRPSGRRS